MRLLSPQHTAATQGCQSCLFIVTNKWGPLVSVCAAYQALYKISSRQGPTRIVGTVYNSRLCALWLLVDAFLQQFGAFHIGCLICTLWDGDSCLQGCLAARACQHTLYILPVLPLAAPVSPLCSLGQLWEHCGCRSALAHACCAASSTC